MTQAKRTLFKYWPVVVSLLLFLCVQIVVAPAISHTSIALIVRTVALLPAAYLIVFGVAYDHYKAFRVSSFYALPVLIVACSVFIVIDPHKAYWFAREDFVIEAFSALAAIAASFVMFLSAFLLSKKRKDAMPTIALAALAIGLGFFIIGAEEISWGQRIFGIESGELFKEHNLQEEINFHNFNTNLMMRLFYIAFFTFFVAVPFFRRKTTTLFNKVKLKGVEFFIPSVWLVPLAITSVVYYRPSLDIVHYFLVMIVVGTLILVYYLVTHPPELKECRFGLFLALFAMYVGLLFAAFVDLDQPGLPYRQFPSEYREFFVCAVILLYSLDVAFRSIEGKSYRRKLRT